MSSVDDLSTQVSPEAVYDTSLDTTMFDGLPIDQQDTWIIPVVRDERKTWWLRTQDTEGQGYVSLVRNLVKSSTIYALSSAALPLVSLVLTPFLAHTLSPTEYGALAVLTTVIALTTGVTQFGLGSSFFRAYNYDYESERDRLGVISTVV